MRYYINTSHLAAMLILATASFLAGIVGIYVGAPALTWALVGASAVAMAVSLVALYRAWCFNYFQDESQTIDTPTSKG